MIFKSRRDGFVTAVFWGTIGLMIFSIFLTYIENGLTGKFYTLTLIILLVIFLLYYVWSGTSYEIKEDHIFYKSGPLHGKIDINKIVSITKNKTLWAGFRPALAKNGLVIRYNTYSEIAITPKNPEIFIDELLKINESIEIK